VFKLGKGKTGYYYNSKLYNWLLSHISNYDVVCVHGLWQYHTYAITKTVKQLKKENAKVPKIIIMPHGMLDPYFQKSVSRKIKALRNEIIWQLTEKNAINQADAIFFTCQEELELARTTFKGYQPKKEINVGYGIQHPPEHTTAQDEAFYNTCPQLKNQAYWLFLSRIDVKKGIDVLIQAYQQLSIKYPTLPHLVIAGNTTSAYAKQMMALSNHHPNIHFPGMVQGNAKWGAFYNCQAFVLPSHQENFGIAIVEAMACKKIVAITKNINIWREINADGGCLLFENNQVESVYKTLEELYLLPTAELKQKGEMAYSTFNNQFYIEHTATVFANVLQQLVLQ
jgi:glycosyltransferase involved in cell wall biosynthesis